MHTHPLVAWLFIPLAFVAGICLTLRLLMLGIYYEYFSVLNSWQIVQSLVYGVRFDLSISAIAYAPFLLILLLSQFINAPKPIVRVTLWSALGAQIILWLLFVASIGYFGEVHRPLGDELLMLGNDLGFVITLMTDSRVLWVLASLLVIAVVVIAWKKLVVQKALTVKVNSNLWNKTAIACVAIGLSVLCIRGFEVTSKPLGVADAYTLGNEVQAGLMMNGAFSVVHNSRRALKQEIESVRYFSKESLHEIISTNASHSSFTRTIPNLYDEKRNVVLILLESWSYKYIDGLSGNNYGTTPFMDSIIEKSMIWTNAYAAGQRSIEGMQAVLTSVPLIEGREVIGYGLEQNRLTKVAAEAKKIGYNTVFMQTSKRRSFQVNAIAGLLGFEHYYGMEDFPEYRQYKEESRFGWDYDGLMFFADYLEQPKNIDKPFFGFFFTGTTHEPFPNPGEEFHVYPHDNNWENRYLNTLKYSDWALEEFMQRMQQHPNYMNTTFIFVADHALRASMTSRYETFHIPLIIYTPDGSLPAQEKEEYVSQYDLLPTLDSLLGLDAEISTFGRSLLTEESLAYPGVLSKQGNIATWMSPQGWYTFDAISGKSLEYLGDVDYLADAIQWSKVRLQLSDQLLDDNEWASK